MQSIEQTIRSYIASNILFSAGDFPYPDDASFLHEGIVDSMNVLELVALVEDQFNLSVDDQELVPANFDSVASLAAFVRAKSGVAVRGAAPADAAIQTRLSQAGV